MPLGNPLLFQTDTNGFGVPKSGGSVGVVAGKVAYTDTSEKTIIAIPDYAIPVGMLVSVVTDFDDTSGDDLKIGLDTNDDYFATALDVSSVGNFDQGDTGMVAGVYGERLGASQSLVATYTETTGDASQGEANILLFYILAGDTVVLE